uniref:C2H2-type domain-containing protein n=1 Tax=Monodelphis domestica TaxID=13616 RepID=A0A5F8GD11_MONDO
MLENVQNLLFVGLPVPRENFISCFQQGKSSQLPEQKDLRYPCLEEETNFEMKEFYAKVSLFLEGYGPQHCRSEDPYGFILREICDSTIKVNQNPKSDSEFDGTAEKFSQYSVLTQYMKLTSGNDYCQDSKFRKCFLEEIGLVQSPEKPEMPMDQGNLGGMTFGWNSDLIRHPRNEYVKKGGRPISQKSELTAHQRIHTIENYYECKQCGKAFTKQSYLAKHQRIHSGEKPYECKQCGKAFTHRCSFGRHQRIHSGEKPYECKQCGKAFTHRSLLTAHQGIHTGEKHYRCKQCEKTFSQRSNLVAHQSIHSGGKHYECKHCGKAFTIKSSLAEHQRIHSVKKP